MKPGWKTSEFALTIATMIVGALLASGVIADGSQTAKILGVIAMVLSKLGYTWSRTSLKASESTAPDPSTP